MPTKLSLEQLLASLAPSQRTWFTSSPCVRRARDITSMTASPSSPKSSRMERVCGLSPLRTRTRQRSSPPFARWGSTAFPTPATLTAWRRFWVWRAEDDDDEPTGRDRRGNQLGQVSCRRTPTPTGTWTTAATDRAEVTRLGEGIEESGAIAPAAIERTASVIAAMAAEAKRLGVDGIIAAGTMGLRTATNSHAFIDLVKERCGVTIEVISGEEECRVAFMAVKSSLRYGQGRRP